MNQMVFVTYHPVDRRFALQLAETLKAHGIPSRIDEWNFPPGGDRDAAYIAIMRVCTHFLVVLSPEASSSPEIDSHIYYALQQNKNIIPVLFRRSEIQLRLRGREYVDYIALGEKDALRKILRLFGKGYKEPAQGRKAIMKTCALISVGIILTLTTLFCLVSFLVCSNGSC